MDGLTVLYLSQIHIAADHWGRGLAITIIRAWHMVAMERADQGERVVAYRMLLMDRRLGEAFNKMR